MTDTRYIVHRFSYFWLWKLLLGWGLVTGALVSCSNSPISTTSTESVVIQTNTTNQVLSTSTKTFTPASTPSATSTLRPTVSPTLTQPPSETPLTALQVTEAQQVAEELLKSNANCLLPCWWGIVPGRTSWSVAQSFLYQFDQEIYSRTAGRNEPFVAEVLIPVRKEIFSLGRLNHFYRVDDDKVQLIDLFPGKLPTYSLSEIFSSYGKPEEIWVRTAPDSPSGYVDFEVVLFYPTLGIIASYNQEAQKDASRIQVCLPPEFATRLVLWAPSNEYDFESAIRGTFFANAVDDYRLLQEITQVTQDGFFEELSKPDAILCLDTPIDSWR